MAVRDRSDLVDDLTYLRKAAGLTVDRLRNAPAVIAYCGGPDASLDTVRTRLITALHALQHRGGPALQAAYGIQPGSAAGTTERRQTYATSIGKRPNTVLEWENSAIAELALILLTAYYAGSATPTDLIIPHGGFLIEALHVVTVYRDRRFVESHQTRRLLSLVDGAAGFRYGTYSPSELSSVSGATTDPAEQHDGGTMHTLRFPKPLQRGQVHSFGFRERVPETAVEATPPTADFSGQSFESPTLRYRNELCFLGEAPLTLWTYDKLSRIERPSEPTADNRVQLHGRSVLSVDFTELYGGLCSGVAWRW